MAARSQGLRPLLKWVGGKTYWAKRLAALLPEHRVYVEPFAGGAAVFFRKKPAELEVLADANPFPIQFYRRVRKGELRKCQGGIQATEANLKRSADGKTACDMLARSVLTFRGNLDVTKKTDNRYFREKRMLARQRLKHLPRYEARLKKVKLVTGDFEATMRQYDAPDAVHFLDPPWRVDDSKMYQIRGTKADDPKHVKRVADSMQGHVVVIYNDVKSIRDTFCRRPWTCKSLEGHANAKGSQGGMRKRRFLVAIKPAASRARRKAA